MKTNHLISERLSPHPIQMMNGERTVPKSPRTYQMCRSLFCFSRPCSPIFLLPRTGKVCSLTPYCFFHGAIYFLLMVFPSTHCTLLPICISRSTFEMMLCSINICSNSSMLISFAGSHENTSKTVTHSSPVC